MVLTFVRRTTSPVRYESAPVLAEDIICPGSDEEESSDELRDRKRRRVEALATRYLQGRGLLIQTASLRGPFDRGWKNPWAKRRPRYPAGDIRRYPETDRRSHTILDSEAKEAESVSSKGKTILDKEKTPIVANAEGNPRTEPPVSSPQQPTTKKIEPDPTLEELPTVNGVRSKDHTSWLRHKSFELPPIEYNTDPSSTPTPLTTGAKATKKHQPVSVTEKDEGQGVKRLAPYVSSFIVDQASSKNAIKISTRSPKPALQAAPPSTNLPEFRYRPAKAKSIPEKKDPLRPSERSRTASSSSSGSSAFAEALEAAQAKVSSGGGDFSSSHTSSPNIQQKADLQARSRNGNLKRLSFTASGSVKISSTNKVSKRAAPKRAPPATTTSSEKRKKEGDSNTSSAMGVGAGESLEEKEEDMVQQQQQQQQSSQNKGIELVHGSSSRTTNLPEAQVVPNAPAPPLPSGYSTNPLETDHQSPKQLDTEEGDSILKLSTQAAVSRAQRSFQGALNDDDDVVDLPDAPSTKHAADHEIHQAAEEEEEGGKEEEDNDDPLIRTVDPELRNLKMELGDAAATAAAAAAALPNTQAMLASFSPFTVTTVKKKRQQRPPPSLSLKKRTSFAVSPTKNHKREIHQPHARVTSPSSNPLADSSNSNDNNKPEHSSPLNYRKNSLSMSTSSSTSPVRHKKTDQARPSSSTSSSSAIIKPTSSNTKQQQRPPASSSTRTSFSILPNGTFSEEIDPFISNPEANNNQTTSTSALPDGQIQPNQPPLAPSSGWPDLETDWAVVDPDNDNDNDNDDNNATSDPFRFLTATATTGTEDAAASEGESSSQQQSPPPLQHQQLARSKGRTGLNAIALARGDGDGDGDGLDPWTNSAAAMAIVDCDVDAVVEEAGRFLGEWQVEREGSSRAARQQQLHQAGGGGGGGGAAAPKGVLASTTTAAAAAAAGGR